MDYQGQRLEEEGVMGIRRYGRGWVAMMVCGGLLMAGLAVPNGSHAIPVAGEYVFISGLTGTFTSDGNRLTAWSIDDPNTDVVWNSANTLQEVTSNVDLQFVTRFNSGGDTGTTSTLEIVWDDLSFATIIRPNDSNGEEELRIDSGIVAFGPQRASVPEPSSILSALIGVALLAAYTLRQRRMVRAAAR
jgi:hypothetical protein